MMEKGTAAVQAVPSGQVLAIPVVILVEDLDIAILAYTFISTNYYFFGFFRK